MDERKITKVLLVGAGRRVTFAHLLKDRGCEVFGYELESEVPLADEFKVFVGKKWEDEDFDADLTKIIVDNQIDLVIPLDCKGVLKLSGLKLPTQLCCGGVKEASICLDKVKLEIFMQQNFLSYYPSPELHKPCILKPRFGYGSNGVESKQFYHHGLENHTNIVIQKKLPGTEFSVDGYFNQQGKLVGASPRERIWVSGGEVIESMTLDYPELIEMTRQIGEKMGIKGTPVCFQYIHDENDDPKLIEINLRAGGGSTISIGAGFDFIQYILDEYIYKKEVKENSQKAEPNVYCSRSFRDHFFRTK